MLPSKVVVNLLPKLGHGLDRVANDRWFEHDLPRGRHNLLDKRRGGYVHSNSLRKKGNNRGPGFALFVEPPPTRITTLSPPKLQMTLKARTLYNTDCFPRSSIGQRARLTFRKKPSI